MTTTNKIILSNMEKNLLCLHFKDKELGDKCLKYLIEMEIPCLFDDLKTKPYNEGFGIIRRFLEMKFDIKSDDLIICPLRLYVKYFGDEN